MTKNTARKSIVPDISVPGGFEEFYGLYSDRVYRYIWYRTRNSETAGDFTQETFLRLWRMRDSIDEGRSITGLMFTIATNLLINHFKKTSRYSTGLEGDIPDDSFKGSGENRELRQNISHAIKTLSEEQQLVFALHIFEGFKNREIAEMLGVSVKTVEYRLTKVYKFIRENCAELF